MARMLRRSRTLRWYCVCCSPDLPTRHRRIRNRAAKRRRVKRMARALEERLWRSEVGEDS